MKTEKKSIPDQVFKELLLAISSGEIAPGEKLPSEFELCEQFGVSRPSVKTAIDRLKLLGIVEQKVGDGTYAKEIGMSDFFSIYATYFIRPAEIQPLRPVIHAIETEACQLIINAGTLEPLTTLRQLAQMIPPATERSDQDSVISTALTFHQQICTLSGNCYLRQLQQALEPALKATLSNQLEHTQLNGTTYQNLCDALERADSQAAATILATLLGCVDPCIA